jgi:hypothetical protein
MKATTLTVQERFEAAISEAAENGLQFIENHEGDYTCQCCTDVSDEIEDVNAPYAYNLVWDTGFQWTQSGNVEVFQMEVRAEQIWEGFDEDGEDLFEEVEVNEVARLGWTNQVSFSHDNGGAELLATALRNQGFEVEWDGNWIKQVIVTLK